MAGSALLWMWRMGAIEREFKATRFSVEHVKSLAVAGHPVLQGETKLRDLNGAVERIEHTFVIRLFVEFESALRAFIDFEGLDQPKWAQGVIDKVAQRANVVNDLRKRVQEVRDFRNQLVHTNIRKKVDSLSMREVTSRIVTFLSRLQNRW